MFIHVAFPPLVVYCFSLPTSHTQTRTNTNTDKNNPQRARTHPESCNISYNHLHHWGFYAKQTSAVFVAMSRDTMISHNVAHDGPRAAFNQNDGFAGASTYEYNLGFNSVLESGDHGVFNSWCVGAIGG